MIVRVGTSGSRLALRQSEMVAEALRQRGAQVDVLPIRTSGDRLAQVALADFGGKALFVKEIEEALLDGRVDAGVHSLKDMPSELPAGLCLACFLPREDPRDVLITRSGGTLADLPRGGVVGTSSLRRQVLLRARRPDVRIEPIRGNVETRIQKLQAGQYDALVMAQAGLTRLGLRLPYATPLPPEEFLPAVGQGIVGVEAREADGPVLDLLLSLDHSGARVEALAERSFLARLGAGCHTPVAGWARRDGEALVVSGLVASPDGKALLRESVSGSPVSAADLGARLADALLARGAAALLGLAGGPLP